MRATSVGALHERCAATLSPPCPHCTPAATQQDPGTQAAKQLPANQQLVPLDARIQVPYRLLKAFHKIQPRLVRELEKKFSGKDVVFIGTRRIMPPPKNGKSITRPRSRTLTAVSGEWDGQGLQGVNHSMCTMHLAKDSVRQCCNG